MDYVRSRLNMIMGENDLGWLWYIMKMTIGNYIWWLWFNMTMSIVNNYHEYGWLWFTTIVLHHTFTLLDYVKLFMVEYVDYIIVFFMVKSHCIVHHGWLMSNCSILNCGPCFIMVDYDWPCTWFPWPWFIITYCVWPWLA